MSMFVVSENCLNDVANLIIKLYPYMDLKEVFNRLLKLNIEVWNNKYNRNENSDDFNYEVVDYSDFVYKSDSGLTKFKAGYNHIQITQLINSLSCYVYQIEENYIKSMDCKFTSSMINEVYNNSMVVEIMNYIKYNKLNLKDRVNIDGVEWNR